MAEQINTDVCVIGAGPAGMLLSLLLLRQGVRVVVVERSNDFEREFRGEFLQPGALYIMKRLGLLDKLRERGEVITHYQIRDHNKVIMTHSFEELEGEFQAGLNVSQAYVLPLILEECQRHAGFVFQKGFAPTQLMQDGDRVRGVKVEAKDGTKAEIRSKLVVGADGRSSNVRSMSGLPVYKHPFQMDILWTKIPRPKTWGKFIEVRIHENGYLVTMPSFPDQLQLGVDMPKGGLKKLRDQGLERLVDNLVLAIPEAEKELRQTLTSWKAFQQLPVTGALATKWYKPGLVLIGDAAHTIGPIAGQGVTQALKDAVLLSQAIVGNLSGDVVDENVLRAFQDERFDEVKSLYKLQSSQERLLMTTSYAGRLTRRAVYWAMMNTPLKKKLAMQMSMKDIEARLK